MDLELTRLWKTDKSTSGVLIAKRSGVIKFTAYTLEPVTRNDDVKPRAIPCGIFKLRVYLSPKRGYRVALLEDVSGFEAVEIHIGNFPKDTEGCILVGRYRGQDELYESEVMFNQLMPLLEQAEAEGDINTIAVIDGTVVDGRKNTNV